MPELGARHPRLAALEQRDRLLVEPQRRAVALVQLDILAALRRLGAVLVQLDRRSQLLEVAVCAAALEPLALAEHPLARRRVENPVALPGVVELRDRAEELVLRRRHERRPTAAEFAQVGLWTPGGGASQRRQRSGADARALAAL